jgi:DNA-binding CsgD family transcriptional regulator
MLALAAPLGAGWLVGPGPAGGSGAGGVGGDVFAKAAVTPRSPLMDTSHGPVPAHAPDHPANVEPLDGRASTRTTAPWLKPCRQSVGHQIPAGALDTVPAPVPAATGFLLKDTPSDRLLDAVRVAAAGEALIAPRITRRLIADFARASRPAGDELPPALAELTAREIEVLRLVAQGLSNAEIAAELVLGENTIKTHVGRLLAKLELRDRVQAVVLAYETGLVTPDVPV